MHAQTHAKLLGAINVATCVIGVPLTLALIYVWASSDSPAPLLALVAVTLVAHTVVRFLPVRCSISGCRGLMVKKRTRISGDKARLIYRCSICGSAYATRVFYPAPSGNYDPDRWG